MIKITSQKKKSTGKKAIKRWINAFSFDRLNSPKKKIEAKKRNHKKYGDNHEMGFNRQPCVDSQTAEDKQKEAIVNKPKGAKSTITIYINGRVLINSCRYY